MIWLLTVKRIAGAGLAWLAANPYRVIFGALLAATVYLWLSKGAETRRADKWQAEAVQMRRANTAATEKANKNAARVAAEYKEIQNEAKQNQARYIADSRAVIGDWVRKNNRNSTGQAYCPANAYVPTGATRAEALPVVPDRGVILPESDLDKIAVIQATLAALQDAARKVSAVNTGSNE